MDSEFDFTRHAAEMRFRSLADGLGVLAAAEAAKTEAEIDTCIAQIFLTGGVTVDDQVRALDLFVDAQSRLTAATIGVRSAWSALQN